MRLSEIATQRVICVQPGDSLDKAICLMEEHGIHHLPVTAEGAPVGMLSDRDLLLGVGWKLGAERRIGGRGRRLAGPAAVADVMSAPVVTLHPHDTVHAAASVLIDHTIGVVPLVEGGRLTGVVTKFDLLRRFCDLPRTAPGARVLDEPVELYMRAKVFTTGPGDSIQSVVELMHERHLRHVPVVVEGALIGMISDRDVRRSCGVERIEDEMAQDAGEFYMGASRAMEIMSKSVRTVPPHTPMRAAAAMMADARIGALPILREERLIGIITETDFVRLLSRMDD